jgi:glucosamine-6-phosphate deaminase
MKFVKLSNKDEVAQTAAELLSKLDTAGTSPVVALPTGKTPLQLYQRLVQLQNTGQLDLAGFTWFALDEFCGIGVPRSSTFGSYLETHFILPAGLSVSSLHALDFNSTDANAEAVRYEQSIAKAGGLDLAILGIGHNGHIGFNEPGTSFASRTGPRNLAPRTREANAYLFADSDMPYTAISMGIGTIMEAHRILLMATGEAKAEIIHRLSETDPTTALPASVLKNHPNCVVLVDEGAGARL